MLIALLFKLALLLLWYYNASLDYKKKIVRAMA